MAVIYTGESVHFTPAPSAVIHIKRSPNTPQELTPALCNDRYGFGVVLAEGEGLGEPWPYTVWCVVCKDAQHGDIDDPEGNAAWE